MLMVTNQKQQKPHKGDTIDFTHCHIAWVSMWCWVISAFCDFAVMQLTARYNFLCLSLTTIHGLQQ